MNPNDLESVRQRKLHEKKNAQSGERKPIQRSMSDPFDTQEDLTTLGISEEASDENFLSASRARARTMSNNINDIGKIFYKSSASQYTFNAIGHFSNGKTNL